MSIVKNTFIGLIAKVSVLGIIFINNFLLLKFLGPKAQGIFFIILVTNGLLLNFLNFGINVSNTTFLAKDNSLYEKINSNNMVMALAVGIVSTFLYSLLMICFKTCLRGYADSFLLVFSFVLVPFGIYELLWSSMMVGLNEIFTLNIYMFSKNLVLLMVNCYVLIILKKGLVGAVLSWACITMFFFIIMLAITAKSQKLKLAFYPDLFKAMFSFGIKNYWGNVATNIWRRFDTYAVGIFNGVSYVGYYSLAVNLRDVIWQLIEPISNAIFPMITSFNRKKSGELAAAASRHTVLNSSLLSALFLILGYLGIRVILGPTYAPSVLPLIILLSGASGVAISMILSIYLIGQANRPGLVSILAWVNTFINIVLCLVLIPKYNIVGAAVSSTIMCFSGAIIMVIVFKHFSGQRIFNSIIIQRSDFHDYKKMFKRLILKIKSILNIKGRH